MYEFISDSLDSRQVFNKIDSFYDGWFTSRKIDWKDFLEIFPRAFSWTKDEIFPAMLWMYYNYPVDYLVTKNTSVPRIKNYRRSNLIRIACFLKSAKVDSPINILKEITTGYATQGRNKMFKNDQDRFEFLNQVLENDEIKGIEETLFDKEPYKTLLKDLIKRSDLKIMFTKKAIELDNTLIPKLLQKFTVWEAGWLEIPHMRGKVAAKTPKKKGNIFDQLMMDMERQKVGEVKVAKDEPIKHNVTNKPFIPYREQIGFDIDPAIISDKIKQISGEKSVPGNWENRASSVEDWGDLSSSGKQSSGTVRSEQSLYDSENSNNSVEPGSDDSIEI